MYYTIFMKHFIAFCLSTLISFTAFSQTNVQIIPYPNTVKLTKGGLNISKGVFVRGNSEYINYLKEILKNEFQITVNDKKKGVEIVLSLTKGDSQNAEAYGMTIEPTGIKIQATDEKGVFYGIQSLKQLLISDREQLPLVSIKDEPAFKWRSYMLDEARYFQGKGTVKKLLDEMALLKMNRFHWHLTNDAGWRIEIKAFPLLTQIGSKRDSTQINDEGKKWKSRLSDHKEHSGFYTQEEIKEIIAYAAERQITIIPEISMPGHSSAAIASYPFLGVSKQQIPVPTNFGVLSAVLDVSDPRVSSFYHQVLKEVAALFPSNYIHIGGDEVKFDEWKQSQNITAYMNKHSIKNYYDLQVNFTNEISKFMEDSLGKKMIGWNEILGKNVHEWSNDENASTTLSKNTIVQFWKGEAKDLLYGIDKGYEIINSNHKFTYLDYTYKQIDLQKAYSFNPIPEGLSSTQQKQIVGLGAQMWSEWTPTAKEIEYQTFPRIAAYAETGWTNFENKNYQRFSKSLKNLVEYWRKKKINFVDNYIAE